MWHLGGDIDVVRPLVDGVEELTERVPVPLQPLMERGAGNVLDALHQLDQLAVVAVVHRREPDAAVAHHHGGDAVPRRRLEAVVPGGLPVVVGVDVDDAGDHERTVGVDLAGSRTIDPSHLDDQTVAHRHVGRAGVGPVAVVE